MTNGIEMSGRKLKLKRIHWEQKLPNWINFSVKCIKVLLGKFNKSLITLRCRWTFYFMPAKYSMKRMNKNSLNYIFFWCHSSCLCPCPCSCFIPKKSSLWKFNLRLDYDKLKIYSRVAPLSFPLSEFHSFLFERERFHNDDEEINCWWCTEWRFRLSC